MLNLVTDCCKLKLNQSQPGRRTGNFFYCSHCAETTGGERNVRSLNLSTFLCKKYAKIRK